MSFADELLKGEVLLQDVTPAIAAIIGFFNPAIGAVVMQYGPVAESFLIKETSVLINFKSGMTKDEMIAALEKSKSATWNIQPLETPAE